MDLTLFKETVKKAEKLFNVSLDYDFELSIESGIFVSLSGNKVIIKGKEKTDFSRALMLLSVKLKEGKKEFEISEKRHFETLGFSLDLSRNGVIKVEKIKEIIDIISLLGFNVLKLYMEDVFDLPGYPHFGYRRGKYSKEELKEIDDYAYLSGVEVIPSVQTLGHLSQYLRYFEAKEFSENSDVLLSGEEKTYEFIEAIVKRMRECFRTNRLVINCDEARGVGVTKIMSEKKYISPYEVSMKHLESILNICSEYNFRPCVHGDLFYGHLGNGYYDFEFKVKKEDAEKIPDVDVIYWDYYHTEYDDYKTLLNGHKSLGKNTLFMGGIWIWAGQLPNVNFTYETMKPAMECCLNNNVCDVWAATFGDDGNETHIAFALPQLLIFSEYCFKGNKCAKEWINKLSKYIFNLDFEEFSYLSDYHYPFVNGLSKEDYIFPNYMGKKIFYTDILYNMTGTYDFSELVEVHKNALKKIKYTGNDNDWKPYFDYARLIYEICIDKMELIMLLRESYLKKDKISLAQIAKRGIPKLHKKYEKLMEINEKQWLETYKCFGWEELNCRYISVMGRLEYASRRIGDYVNDKINCIEEMEYDFIEEINNVYSHGKNVAFYSNLKSTGV